MSLLAPPAPVAVIGAGTMGEGIAQVAAVAGHRTTLFDARDEVAPAAIASITRRMERSVERGKRSAEDAAAIVDRLSVAHTIEEVGDASLVIEAIIEDLGTKRDLFRQLEAICGPDVVLATNTSSISITAIAGGLSHPGRVAGLHFFNPAPVMELVEVVSGLATDPATTDALAELAITWGKTPVLAASSPGFIGNRVARPFYGEGLRLLQEGVADVATIDALVREAGGFRMGPFELLDLVGIDVNLAVTMSVFEASGHDPRFAPNVIQQEMVAAGRCGRKTAMGFYDHAKPLPAAATITPGEAPSAITVSGDIGPLESVVARLETGGVTVTREPDGRGVIEVGDIVVAMTDGRMATDRALADGADLVLVDLAYDYATAPRVGCAVAAQAQAGTLETVAALFAKGGIEVSVVEDLPAMVVMRVVASIINLAMDTAHLGIASIDDIDTAMRLGFSYPLGPIAWGTRLGAERVETVMDHLHDAYGEDRYRASVALRRQSIMEG